MKIIDNIEALEDLYAKPLSSPLNKIQNFITPNYRAWIGFSRFLVLTKVGPEGTDASPRGDTRPVAEIKD